MSEITPGSIWSHDGWGLPTSLYLGQAGQPSAWWGGVVPTRNIVTLNDLPARVPIIVRGLKDEQGD